MRTADEMLNTAQAAQELGVSTKTVRKWADAGELPCWRTPGNRRRYRLSDIRVLRGETNGEAEAVS